MSSLSLFQSVTDSFMESDTGSDSDDDLELQERPRSSFPIPSPPFSFPRKSRSRDPHSFRPPNPNLRLHEDNDSDDHGVARKKPRFKEDANWSERAAAILLEVWGEKFVREGRRSLRSDEWRDVAERVSHAARIEATEAQCRAVLETMKKRYKEERETFVELGIPSAWGYYRKMEGFLFAGAPGRESRRGGGLACGVDSGEFVFADAEVYLDQANGYDEMRDSPAESEEDSGGEENGDSGESVRVLAESVERFREIYGKVESDKRRQMVEVEKMRMDFQRDLEIQKRQIMERTRIEIAKIRASTPDEEHRDDEDEDEDEEEDGDDDDELSNGGRG